SNRIWRRLFMELTPRICWDPLVKSSVNTRRALLTFWTPGQWRSCLAERGDEGKPWASAGFSPRAGDAIGSARSDAGGDIAAACPYPAREVQHAYLNLGGN